MFIRSTRTQQTGSENRGLFLIKLEHGSILLHITDTSHVICSAIMSKVVYQIFFKNFIP